MDISELFSFSTLFLALGCYVVTTVIRRPIEAIWPFLRTNRIWTKVVLPLVPVVLGVVLALLVEVLPEVVLAGNRWDRALHGMVAGFFSAAVFRGVKAFLKSKGVNISSYPPPGDAQ